MSRKGKYYIAIAALAAALTVPTAHAEDTLRVAAGQRGNWDTTIAEIGQRGGIFKKNGLSLEILYTQGAGETQQAVIAGTKYRSPPSPKVRRCASTAPKQPARPICSGMCLPIHRSRRSRIPTARR